MGWFGSSSDKKVEKLKESPEKRKKEEDKVIQQTKKDLNDLKKSIKK